MSLTGLIFLFVTRSLQASNINLPQSSQGWAVVNEASPPPDVIKIYVTTNVSNPGISYPSAGQKVVTISGLSSAIKTVISAKKVPWVFFQRGQTFIMNLSAAIGNTGKSSSSSPMVMTSYGSWKIGSDGFENRPILLNSSPGSTALNFTGSLTNDPNGQSLAIIGLHIWGNIQGSYGIRWVMPGANVLIEDCYIQGETENGLNFDVASSGGMLTNLSLHHSVVADSIHLNNSCTGVPADCWAGQGLYASNITSLNIEDSVFDHNGWSDTDPNTRNEYRHQLYLKQSVVSTLIQRTIFLRATDGIQLRNGGNFIQNFVADQSLGLNLTYRSFGTVTNNVILEASSQNSNTWEGGGILAGSMGPVMDGDVLDIESNLILHNLWSSSSVGAINIQAAAGVIIKNNLVYSWKPTSVAKSDSSLNESSNNFTCSGCSFPITAGEPSYLATYQLKEGVANTTPKPSNFASLQGFANEARKQSRNNWRLPYTATQVNNFFRSKFIMP